MSDVAAFTEGDLDDIELCKRVALTLQRFYPNHPWLVSMQDKFAGVLVIDLPYKPPSLRNYAYLLHLANVDDEQQVRNAGGEWLERIGLARARAEQWATERAAEHGLDLSNVITKIGPNCATLPHQSRTVHTDTNQRVLTTFRTTVSRRLGLPRRKRLIWADKRMTHPPTGSMQAGARPGTIIHVHSRTYTLRGRNTYQVVTPTDQRSTVQKPEPCVRRDEAATASAFFSNEDVVL